MASDSGKTADSSLFDEAPCGLLETADDGMILIVNRTFCRWVGDDCDALVGRRRFQDLLTMGGRIFHQTHWSPLLRMQGSLSEVKLEVRHSNGDTIPMVLNALRHERGGRIVHEIAAFIARDRDKYERELVLSRKRLEDLVAEATRLQADAKDRAVFAEQMIGIVSHDLRNPLSTITMGTALLGNEDLGESQRRLLMRISRSADRANRLIADLLDFTQARVGKGLTSSLEPVNLHRVISDAVEELALVYPMRSLEHVRIGDGGCSGDAHRLAQLVGNLVSNAMVYGREGAPVTVTSSIAEGACRVAVRNEGTAIPAEIQATIFQPMTRGTTSGSSRRSVGLGLYIVSEIARAHGGRAAFASTADGVTTFTVTFPRVQPDR